MRTLGEPAAWTSRASLANEPVTIERASDGAAWDGYVGQHASATSDHLWGWRKVIESSLGHSATYLAARRGASLCGVLPLVAVRSRVFGKSLISVPFLNYGGVLADDEGAAQALLEAARGEARAFGATHVELRHIDRRFEALPFRQHKLRMLRTLESSADELWSGLDRKIRNQVRKAQKEALVPEMGGAELIPEFYQVFAHNMRDLGTPVYSRGLFDEAVRAFPDQLRVFVIRHGRQPVAGGVTVLFRGTTLNPWASSLREFRHLCPNMLLYWEMMRQAIIDGASVFDFGRSSPDSGPHQFKSQWGAHAIPMHWEYLLLARSEPPDQGPSSPRFERAIDLWKRLPLAVANLVGPRLARHLP